MIKLTYALFTLLAVTVISCPDEINPPEIPPGPVRIKFSPGLTSPVETGTRSLASFQDQIRVEWSTLPPTDNIIEEYIVYRSISVDSQFFPVGNRVVTSSEADSFFIDENVFMDTVYYYFVVARDSRDNFSDTATYFQQSGYIASVRLGQKVLDFIHPVSDTSASKPVFRWCLAGLAPVTYLVKVATPTQQVIWIAEKQNGTFDADCFNPNNHEYLTLHNVSYTTNDSLIAKNVSNVSVHYINSSFFLGGRLKKDSYLWRIDCNFGDAESKSGWLPFTITKD